jgi:hypothetical protein
VNGERSLQLMKTSCVFGCVLKSKERKVWIVLQMEVIFGVIEERDFVFNDFEL